MEILRREKGGEEQGGTERESQKKTKVKNKVREIQKNSKSERDKEMKRKKYLAVCVNPKIWINPQLLQEAPLFIQAAQYY